MFGLKKLIDLEKIYEAYKDVMGTGPDDEENGYDIDEIEARFNMLGIDFTDFRIFMLRRLETLGQVVDMDAAWTRGYVHAAMEFFLYGNITGKETATTNDDLNDWINN
jgi:hypothetical protein